MLGNGRCDDELDGFVLPVQVDDMEVLRQVEPCGRSLDVLQT